MSVLALERYLDGPVSRYMRAYCWRLLILNRGFATGLSRPAVIAQETVAQMRDLTEVLSERVVYWMGSPLSRKPKEFKMNLLMLYRCKLSRLLSIVADLIFRSEKHQDKTAYYAAARSIGSNLEEWYKSLPSELCYRKDMPPGLYEFQYACTNSALLIVH